MSRLPCGQCEEVEVHEESSNVLQVRTANTEALGFSKLNIHQIQDSRFKCAFLWGQNGFSEKIDNADYM